MAENIEVLEADMSGEVEGGSESSESELLPAANKKSAVWTYFGYKKGPDGKAENVERVTCKVCKVQYWAKGGNTSNLFRHLESCHPKEFEMVKTGAGTKKAAQPKLSTAKTTKLQQTPITSFNKYKRDDAKWKLLTEKLTFCLAKDLLPIYSVEKRGFKEMIRTFDPRYELPSRKYFTQTAIPKLYNKTKEAIKEELGKEVDFFSATSDLWSSRRMEPYMSLTAHYIDSNWKLQSRCLETIFVPQDHIALNLAEVFKEVLSDWDLPTTKLVAITTHNAGNIVNAVTSMGVNHVSCFGHNLNLAVTKSWKDDNRVSRAVGVCKSIVSHFSHSWQKRRELAKFQEELGLKLQSLKTVCISLSILESYLCKITIILVWMISYIIFCLIVLVILKTCLKKSI
ncbi:E3 SUMO-protein ligase ZBED1-like [Apostichopus japonicus]|uniref:E3 SUMO-protein ligase ZBED1-like n=1 Tax=Stichopus japonicus TaxID=307972 RepID=UPI003AB3B93B